MRKEGDSGVQQGRKGITEVRICEAEKWCSPGLLIVRIYDLPFQNKMMDGYGKASSAREGGSDCSVVGKGIFTTKSYNLP